MVVTAVPEHNSSECHSAFWGNGDRLDQENYY